MGPRDASEFLERLKRSVQAGGRPKRYAAQQCVGAADLLGGLPHALTSERALQWLLTSFSEPNL